MFSEAFITQVIVLAGILAAFALSAATQDAPSRGDDVDPSSMSALWFLMSGFSAVFAVIWGTGYFVISDAEWRGFLAHTMAGSIGFSMTALLVAAQLIVRNKYPGLNFLGLTFVVAVLPPLLAALGILLPRNVAYVILIPLSIIGLIKLFSAKG